MHKHKRNHMQAVYIQHVLLSILEVKEKERERENDNVEYLYIQFSVCEHLNFSIK